MVPENTNSVTNHWASGTRIPRAGDEAVPGGGVPFEEIPDGYDEESPSTVRQIPAMPGCNRLTPKTICEKAI